MQENKTLSRAEWLDKIFGTPVFAVLLAIFCNVLWGSAFPFIKLGYRLFAIDSSSTASIFCFAGVRFMLGSFLVLLGSVLLQSRLPKFPRGKVAAECCALGLWQTTTQYAFYYIAVAMLTGAFGGILNSTQSFLGVIFAHFIYGNADRMTPAKTLGCAVGFAGVLIGTLGNHGSGSGWGVFCMMAATIIFTLSGPWNKSVTKKQTALPSASSTCSWAVWHCSCWALCWAAASMCKTHWRWWSCCIWLSSAGQAMCCGPC